MTDNQQASQSTPTPTPPPPIQSQEAISSDMKTLAMLAHMLGIVSGFVGALVIWLIKKDENSFVTDQAKEALNFQITVAIASIGAMVAVGITGIIGLPLIFLPHLVWIGNVVFSVLAGIKAKDGIAYRYPISLKLIK